MGENMIKRDENKQWFVYVIVNSRNEAYTGVTHDVSPERRIDEHNQGRGAKYTRGRGPWRLAYVEAGFDSRGKAQARERELKRDVRMKSALKEIKSYRKDVSGADF
ncbi:MAG: GIY-YIG nuclease family protein [Rhodospirillales bacterium]|nr:GIY-YIG nuclease family protein [Rhodospirillales bacterium]